MNTPHGYLLWYAWYEGLNGSYPRKWQKFSKIHNFSKIKRIRKIFSEYSNLRVILRFCFLEYCAITLPCYHMGPWYTTHMGWFRFRRFWNCSDPLCQLLRLFVECLLNDTFLVWRKLDAGKIALTSLLFP